LSTTISVGSCSTASAPDCTRRSASRAIVNAAGVVARYFSTTASSSSTEIPITTASGYAAASFPSFGNAFLHGAQYVAQTSSTTTLPIAALDTHVPPSRSFSSSAGNGFAVARSSIPITRAPPHPTATRAIKQARMPRLCASRVPTTIAAMRSLRGFALLALLVAEPRRAEA
jgi:hypothetical protein